MRLQNRSTVSDRLRILGAQGPLASFSQETVGSESAGKWTAHNGLVWPFLGSGGQLAFSSQILLWVL